jgi:hypothetical protein
VDVEQLLAADADALEREVMSFDFVSGLQQVFAALDAVDDTDASSYRPVGPADLSEVGRAPAPRLPEVDRADQAHLRERGDQEEETD